METRTEYSVGNVPPKSIEAFYNRRCALPFNHPDYQKPSPEEVDALIKIMGWSQRQVANLVGIACNDRGSSTVRKWKTKADLDDYRPIPYSAWRLLLIYAGVVTADSGLDAIDKSRLES